MSGTIIHLQDVATVNIESNKHCADFYYRTIDISMEGGHRQYITLFSNKGEILINQDLEINELKEELKEKEDIINQLKQTLGC